MMICVSSTNMPLSFFLFLYVYAVSGEVSKRFFL